MSTFTALSLSPLTLRALEDVGYETPTPVQIGALPPAIEGLDLMVQSQTGTGKTAAFALPLIERLSTVTEISALILTPTRELARQVAEETSRLAQYHEHKIVTIYGGAPFDPQVRALETATIVVGTPGRVIDHLRRRTLNLKHVRCFVLDEADEMLSMGFAEELEQVLKYLPKSRQTLFFSATFPPNVKRYAAKVLKDPQLLSFLDEESSADDLEHYYYMMRGVNRTKDLLKILSHERPKNAIIFVNTRRETEQLANHLTKRGLDAERLSGDMDQRERERVMKKMKQREVQYLVATDVAARGIDITLLSHVIHYQLPESSEVYIHRSGRTGRAGEKGVVLSLVGSKEIGVLYALKKYHHLDMIERAIPAELATVQSSMAQPEPIAQDLSQGDPKAIQDPSKLTSSKSTPSRVERPEVASPEEQRPAHPDRQEATPPPSPKSPLKRRPKRASTRLSSSKAVAPSREAPKEDSNRAVKSPSADARRALNPPLNTQPSSPQTPRSQQIEDQRSASISLIERLRPQLLEVNSSESRDQRQGSYLEAQALHQHEDAVPMIHGLLLRAGLIETQRKGRTAPESKERLNVKRDSHLQKLFLNVGHAQFKNIDALRECIADLGGLLPRDIMSIQMKETYAFIEVKEEFAQDLIMAAHGETLEGRILTVEEARDSRLKRRP
jgi:ATP-dependent RNA helicase DeaD